MHPVRLAAVLHAIPGIVSLDDRDVVTKLEVHD